VGVVKYASLATSTSGQYVCAVLDGGYIYTSKNFGANSTYYQTTYVNQSWKSVAMSASGQYAYAVVNGGYIYQSVDYALDWTAITAAGSRNWISITTSASGQYISAAVVNGSIYGSADFGSTWTSLTNAGSRNWISIAMSASGQYQSAAVTNNTGYIYCSTDFGSTWTQYASSANWISVAMSASGQYQCATVYNGYIYTSINFGVTWTQYATSRYWQDIAISASAQYLTAADSANGGTSYIYASSTAISGQTVPAGSSGQVQYNSGSSTFAGSSNLYWDSTNSRLGIGTTAPLTNLDVNLTGASVSVTQGKYFGRITAISDLSSNAFQYSIRSVRSIWIDNSSSSSASENSFVAGNSDSRIKKDISLLEGSSSLEKIRGLDPILYKHTDDKTESEPKIIGFIAQDVMKYIPSAVKTVTRMVPTVFQYGVITPIDTTTWCISTEENHHLSEQQPTSTGYLQIIIQDTNEKEVEIKVSYTVENETTLTVSKDDGFPATLDNRVFVYGPEVTDFHVLSYDPVIVTAVSAMKEMDNTIQELKERLDTTISEMDNLKERLVSLERK
jgi:hypothetical protein